jgi:hypothetical protein
MTTPTEELSALLSCMFSPALEELDSLALLDLLVHRSFHLESRPLTNCMDDSFSETIGVEEASDIVSACSSIPKHELPSLYHHKKPSYSPDLLTASQSEIRRRLAEVGIEVGKNFGAYLD